MMLQLFIWLCKYHLKSDSLSYEVIQMIMFTLCKTFQNLYNTEALSVNFKNY